MSNTSRIPRLGRVRFACRVAAISALAAIMVAGAVLVLPEALPNLMAGIRANPFAPVIVVAFWLLATAASITGKRLIAAGHLGWAGTTTAHISGTVANRLIPAGVGAAGAFVAALRRGGASNTKAAGAVAMWSAGGGVAHAFGLLLGVALLWGGGPTTVICVVAVLLVIAIWPDALRRAGTCVASWPVRRWAPRRRSGRQPRTTIGRVVRDRARSVTGAIREVISSVRARPMLAVGVIVTQFIAMLSMAAGFAMVAASFGLPVTVVVGMAAYVAGTTLAATTPTPAGIGSAEATLVGALVVVGVGATEALPAVLLFRAVVLLAPVVVAVILATTWPAARKIAHCRG